MKGYYFLLPCLLYLCCLTSLNAQTQIKVDQIDFINQQTNDIQVQLKIPGNEQLVTNRVADSGVNRKAGFEASMDNSGPSTLTLRFTQRFTENELNILLEQVGVELSADDLNQLSKLLAQ